MRTPVKDSKWKINGGSERYGVIYYLREINFAVELNDLDMMCFSNEMAADNPGNFPVRIIKKGEGKYSVLATHDSSD